MKKLLVTFFISMIIVASFLVGCTSSKITKSEQLRIIDINWQWIELDSSNGNPVIVVNGPAKYMLTLKKDGTFAIISDCNSGSGKFTTKDNNLNLALGPITAVGCGEESLSDQYLPYLAKVISFTLKEDRLYLKLKSNEGDMVFVNGG